MSDVHQRYEEMAVGHVLGGLDPVDGADFRSHLMGCRDCRLRVAELRGIASELAAAEREERVAARVKTEVARRQDPDEGSDDRSWRTPGRLVMVVLLGGILGIGLLAWNFHLRDVNRVLLETAVDRERVLSILASGEPVEARFHEGVAGLLAVADGEVALDLSGVPTLGPDRWLAVWFLDDGAPGTYEPFLGGAVSEGRFATHLDHGGADRVVVSLERTPSDGPRVLEEPEGRVLVEADLP